MAFNETQSPVLWPEWQTRRVIGRGSFGTVYEIYRNLFGQEETAAVKHLSIPETESELEELENEGYDAASISTHYKHYLEEIVREYSLMMELKGCGNIVYCDDLRYEPHADGIGWDIFIKMELLTPLKKAATGYNEAQVRKLGQDLCRALMLCESRKIIHRDIKPENIFVSKAGEYKLGDFGVAKISERSATGTKIGTFDYMAPEVYLSKPYGAQADQYSLGLVLYWLMNDRKLPFLSGDGIPSAPEKEEARARRFAGEELPRPIHGSQELWQVVKKACSFVPEQRYATPGALLDALTGKKEEPKPEPKPAPKPEPKPAPSPPPLGSREQPACTVYITPEQAKKGASVVVTRAVGNVRQTLPIPAGVKDGQIVLHQPNEVMGMMTQPIYFKVCIRDVPINAKPKCPWEEVPDVCLKGYVDTKCGWGGAILWFVILFVVGTFAGMAFAPLGFILWGLGILILTGNGNQRKNKKRAQQEIDRRRNIKI